MNSFASGLSDYRRSFFNYHKNWGYSLRKEGRLFTACEGLAATLVSRGEIPLGAVAQ